MTRHLETSKRAPDSGRVIRRPRGWTPERRARQAERIRLWQPWNRSTGPKTQTGKARVAMNALRHGYRGRAWLLRARRIRNAIRLCASSVLLARAFMRQRNGLPCRSAIEALAQPLATDRLTGGKAGPEAIGERREQQ